MDRRKAIKNILVLGAAAALPFPDVFSKGLSRTKFRKRLHIVGLGGGGCNALEYYYKKGLQAEYTCITSPERPYLNSKISFIQYALPEAFYLEDDWSNVELPLPSELKTMFDSDDRFVLLVGLGGATGTLTGKSLFHYLLNENKDFTFVCSYPFSNEGKKRMILAESAFKEFNHCKQFKGFHLNDIRNEKYDLTISQAFCKANENSYKVFLSQNQLV